MGWNMLDLRKFFGKKVCVATSGGADSTALLHYLKTQEIACGYSLSAVHCEHGIRGEESLDDMRFVEAFCRELDVPLTVFSCDCKQRAKDTLVSLETAARAFRRECFSALVTEGKADFIATAHHQSDEAETVLFRLCRGTALSGVKAMSEEDGVLLRPFLTWKKAEILHYVQENGLSYREDSTNKETDATRNKLRLEVFPVLEEVIPAAKENLARFAALAAEDDNYLYRESEKLLSYQEKEIIIAFCNAAPLFRRACLTAMKTLGIEKDYTACHLQSLFSLQDKERGAKVDLPLGLVAEKTGTGIRLFLLKNEEVLPPLPTAEEAIEKMCFDGGRYEVKLLFDEPTDGEYVGKVLRAGWERLPKDAVFRFRKEGDEIEKFGGGTRTLKKFFNEKKIPVKERGYLPLIAQKSGNRVYAVCGVEIADFIKVTKTTQRVVYIILQKK